MHLLLVLAAAKALEGIYGVACPLAALLVYAAGELVPSTRRDTVVGLSAVAGGILSSYIAAASLTGRSGELAARLLPLPVAMLIAVVAAAVREEEAREAPRLATGARRRLERAARRLRRVWSLLTGATWGPRGSR